MSYIKNKHFINILGIIIIVIGLIFLSFQVFSKVQRSDSNKLTLEELTTYGEKNKNIVMMDFSNKYNINSFGKNFWNNKYEDDDPTEQLYDRAFSDLIKHKSIKELANELGVEKYTSFSNEKSEWSEQNNGLSLWQYLDSQDNQLSDKIKDKLSEDENPSEKELKKSFDNLENKYKKTEYFVAGVEIPSYSGSIDELNEKAKKITAGGELEEIVNFWQKELPSLVIDSFQIQSNNIQKEDIYSISIGESLSEHEVGSVVEGYNENQYFYLVEKEGGELLNFDQAPKFAMNAYINDLYEKKLSDYQKELSLKFEEQNKQKFVEYYKNPK